MFICVYEVCRSLRFDKVTCLESAFCRILQSSFPIISNSKSHQYLPILLSFPSFRASAVSHGFCGKGPALKRAEVPRRSPRWCIRFAFQIDRHESRSSSKYVMYNHICMYVCMYVRVCMCVRMSVCLSACLPACLSGCMSVNARTYVGMYASMFLQ